MIPGTVNAGQCAHARITHIAADWREVRIACRWAGARGTTWARSSAGRAEREFTVELVNAAGEVHSTCRKLLSIRAR